MQEPEKVVYKGVSDLKIIYKEEKFSIALFNYYENEVYGICWNGTESEDSKGTPTSYGKPTWFIVPNKLIESFIKVNAQGA